jgi:hypothetical protein
MNERKREYERGRERIIRGRENKREGERFKRERE